MSPQNTLADDANDESIDFGDTLDQNTFDQVLEMDEDDEDREFSKSIVFGFFEQAESTFRKMQDSIESKDLKELSSLGHFLKGSSATIGLTKVKDECEKIQQFGAGKDKDGNASADLNDEKCLELIKEALADAETEYNEVSEKLRRFYGE